MYQQEPRQRARYLSRPWQIASLPLVVALVVGLLPVVSGWPYWTRHTVTAVVAVVMAASLAGAGALLMTGFGSRKTGAFLVIAALLYAAAWLGARNTGAFPLIGEFSQSAFYLVLGIGILLHGRPRFDNWVQWTWTGVAFVVLIGQQVLLTLVTEPSEFGYAPNVVWPSLHPPHAVTRAALEVGGIAYIGLALAFVAALVALRYRSPERNRRRGYPLVVVSGLFAVAAAVIEYPIMRGVTPLDATMTARSAQGAAAIVVPLALFASAMRARWEERTVAAQLINLIGYATPASVEQALRTVLRDPTLTVWLWLPAKRVFVDSQGAIRRSDREEAGKEGTRGQVTVQTPSGEPVALCDVDRQLLAQGDVFRAALDACAPAMLAAQLQVENLEQIRGIQNRLMEAEHEGRKELARNLHDGVQQDLAAVRIELSRLIRLSPSDEFRTQAAECSARIQGVIEELRDITRGLHPPTLSQRGLAGALEEVAERIGKRIYLEVPAERLHPRVELAMYYVLTEAITNAEKHANADTVHVRVQVHDGALIGEVVDNGVGGATMTLGGGLHGVDDRIRAMRGRCQLSSPAGKGTRLKIMLPLLEVTE